MFVSNPSELELYIPHFVQAVKGEKSIFDKIAAHVLQADRWVQSTVCPESFVEKNILRLPKLREYLRTAVACQALSSALSSLDVVLTPNGIGVASTDTIAPASKERSDAMRRDLVRMRDSAICGALILLLPSEEYKMLPAASNWMECIFSPTSPIFNEKGTSAFSLSEYHVKSDIFARIESEIASRAVSDSLMEHLRSVAVDLRPQRGQSVLLRRLRMLILRWVDENIPISAADYLEIVDIIRNDDVLFERWKDTKQAKRYRLEGYKNEKKSGGFFF